MLLFEYILILLAAIYLSNVVNRFLPAVSVPIVQIALGSLIVLLPFRYKLTFDPDLFFVLFVAPIIFYVSMMADKKTMWAQRQPILNMGILLVFTTVLTVGYVVNFFIPSIPLAAAFALVAALGPTDDVAVVSVGKRTNVPPKIMNIMQGESIMNDASGIVSFQFALAAVLTGSFSLLHATSRFFAIALGGIAVGLVFSWFKYILVRWIRSLGMENVTLHLLLGILTPFVIYLIAEGLGVSGILAVFSAGIVHSFNRDKFNPETVNLKIASESVWAMLVFTLEGLVFVILGTQLPQILASISQNYSIATWEIIACILLITLLFLVLRFVWLVTFVRKKTYDDPGHPVSRFRAGIIFSFSGARGAVTLASVMSIPVLLSDEVAFPERDLIILIAGGVIVVSLIITSFILPLCVEKQTDADKSSENEAYMEILQNVITELKTHITPDNAVATAFIVAVYHNRSAEMQRKQNIGSVDREGEREMRLTSCAWEKENTLAMLERGETDELAAQYYLDVLDNYIGRLSKKRFVLKKNIIRFLHHTHRLGKIKEQTGLRDRIFALMELNIQFVLEKLREMSQTDDSPAVRKMMADCESRLSMSQRHAPFDKVNEESLSSVASKGFQIERDNIRTMLENRRISKETATEMRHNLSLLELQLKKDFY